MALITGFSADLVAIISCIICMVTNGKALNDEECADVQKEKLAPFIIGRGEVEPNAKELEESEND